MNSTNINLFQLTSIQTKVLKKGKNSEINIKKGLRTRGKCTISMQNGKISIGKEVFFNQGCIIAAHKSIEIGNYTSFGPNVMIYDHDHIHNKNTIGERKKFKVEPIVIGENVWIGANTIVLKGSIIGDNSVIAAGSIVNGNIPSDSIYIQKRNTIIKKNN